MKRFSIVGWGGSASPPSGSPRSSADFGSVRRDSITRGSPSQSLEAQPLQPQGTGGLWSSWWTSSGGEKSTVSSKDRETEKTPQWYVDGIKNGKATDMKLVKHLISLRVHLSTATLSWVETFVSDCQGFDALGKVLGGLVAKGGKRRRLQEVEETVLLETIKCIRVLLNTDVGSSRSNILSLKLTRVTARFQLGYFGCDLGYPYSLFLAWIFHKVASTNIRCSGRNLLCLSY